MAAPVVEHSDVVASFSSIRPPDSSLRYSSQGLFNPFKFTEEMVIKPSLRTLEWQRMMTSPRVMRRMTQLTRDPDLKWEGMKHAFTSPTRLALSLIESCKNVWDLQKVRENIRLQRFVNQELQNMWTDFSHVWITGDSMIDPRPERLANVPVVWVTGSFGGKVNDPISETTPHFLEKYVSSDVRVVEMNPRTGNDVSLATFKRVGDTIKTAAEDARQKGMRAPVIVALSAGTAEVMAHITANPHDASAVFLCGSFLYACQEDPTNPMQTMVRDSIMRTLIKPSEHIAVAEKILQSQAPLPQDGPQLFLLSSRNDRTTPLQGGTAPNAPTFEIEENGAIPISDREIRSEKIVNIHYVQEQGGSHALLAMNEASLRFFRRAIPIIAA